MGGVNGVGALDPPRSSRVDCTNTRKEKAPGPMAPSSTGRVMVLLGRGASPASTRLRIRDGRGTCIWRGTCSLLAQVPHPKRPCDCIAWVSGVGRQPAFSSTLRVRPSNSVCGGTHTRCADRTHTGTQTGTGTDTDRQAQTQTDKAHTQSPSVP